jgi:hypothetical protein
MLKTFQALLPKYRCGGNTASGTHWPQCFGKGDQVPFRADNRTVNGAINGVNLNYTAKGISIAISITNFKMRRAIPFPRQSITALPSQIQYPRKNVWPFAGYSKNARPDHPCASSARDSPSDSNLRRPFGTLKGLNFGRCFYDGGIIVHVAASQLTSSKLCSTSNPIAENPSKLPSPSICCQRQPISNGAVHQILT